MGGHVPVDCRGKEQGRFFRFLLFRRGYGLLVRGFFLREGGERDIALDGVFALPVSLLGSVIDTGGLSVRGEFVGPLCSSVGVILGGGCSVYIRGKEGDLAGDLSE
jgi:hypothetical protein